MPAPPLIERSAEILAHPRGLGIGRDLDSAYIRSDTCLSEEGKPLPGVNPLKRIVGAMVLGTALLCGCGEKSLPPEDPHADSQRPGISPPPAAANSPAGVGGMNEVIAKVRGEPITMRQLVDPLIESHGLTMLVNLVELELARQNAASYHVVVTDKDFADEHDLTLEKMFKDSDDPKLVDALDKAVAGESSKDPMVAKNSAAEEFRLQKQIRLEREDYLAQFLVNQHIDRVEFDIVLKINTYLRKILESDWKNKITEQDLHDAFGQMYGERVEVRYILLDNMQEVNTAKRRLDAGDSFEQVARDMSHDPKTASLGGELPAFSRESPRLPQNFKDAAFNPLLKDGQVSDVLAVGSSFMLIKRVHVIPPQAVKFENVRDAVYRKLHSALIEAGLKGLKQELGMEAQKEMLIIDPVLKQQVQDKLDRQAKADQKAKEELDRQQQLRDLLKVPETTRPADTAPTTGTAPPAGAASSAPAAATGERPPATVPGSAHAFTLPRLGPDTNPSVATEANK
jgi:hypothetical protein